MRTLDDRRAGMTGTPSESARGVLRFGVRSLLGLVAVVLGAIPFLLLLVLVVRSWGPLRTLDDEVAAGLNEVVSASPLAVDVLRVVTDLGGTGTAVYVFTLATVCLLLRGQRRLAAWFVVTGVGLAVLVNVTKALVGRERPVVELPVVVYPSNASFPSGHAMTSFVMWGALLLVALPLVRKAYRPWLVAATVVLVLAIGATRLALGVHFVSDVIAGYALGAAWLAATTAAFRGWQHDLHEPAPPVAEGLDPQAAPALEPARTREPALPQGRRTLAELALAWAAIAVTLSGLGLLLTRALGGTLLIRPDLIVPAALVTARTTTLTQVAELISTASGTRAIIAVSLAQAVLAVAVSASWRPFVFVLLSVVGEVTIYGTVAFIVERARPDVPDLTEGLPVRASWPSGHVAAATVVYGALCVLVIRYARSRWRFAVLALPVLLVPAVALSRLYVAAHHPSDVAAGLVLGVLWLLALTAVLFPRWLTRAGRGG